MCYVLNTMLCEKGMEINEDHPNKNKLKAIYSELARQSATIMCTWQRLKDKQEEWKSFIVGKRERTEYALIRGIRHGETEVRLTRSGHPM